MSEVITITVLLSQGLIFATAVIGLIGAHKKVNDLHISLNSRLDQLLDATRNAGIEEGRRAEVERRKSEGDE